MKKYLVYLFSLIILFTSCVSSTVEETQQVNKSTTQDILSLVSLSSYEDNVYVGVSNPYVTQEKMLEVAILNVAQDILIDEFLVLSKLLISENSSDFNYTYFDTDELFVYQDEHLPEIIKSLEILEIYFDKEAGCIVIARDTREEGKERVYKPEYNESGVPTWVYDRPEIDGYIVGVGSTLGYRLIGDSLLAADHEAIYDISSQFGNIDSYIKNYYYLKQNDLYTLSKESKIQKELAVVSELTNIDYWYDKQNNIFYSLIIMKDTRSDK